MLSYFAITLIALSSVTLAKNRFDPSKIEETESPNFSADGYFPAYNFIVEERTYPAKTWVCTSPSVQTAAGEKENTFMKLFAYIQGENDKGMIIKMTTPVTKKYEGKQMLEMCFFLGEEHQADPPQPTGEGVFLNNVIERQVYAVRFPGKSSNDNYVAHKEKLKKFLIENNMSANMEMPIRAGYSAPWEQERRNEIWYIKNNN